MLLTKQFFITLEGLTCSSLGSKACPTEAAAPADEDASAAAGNDDSGLTSVPRSTAAGDENSGTVGDEIAPAVEHGAPMATELAVEHGAKAAALAAEKIYRFNILKLLIVYYISTYL